MEETKPISYLPILVVFASALLGAFAIAPYFFLSIWMRLFMGIFLLILATLKLFDVKGFSEGFSLYDPLAKLFRPYGYIFPFIEFFTALLLLRGGSSLWIAFSIIAVVYGINSIGSLMVILEKKRLFCACMGTSLRIPLGVLTLIEDVVMVGMSVFALVTM